MRCQVAGSVLLMVLFVIDLRWQPGGGRVTRGVDDLAQLGAAVLAGGAAGWRARMVAGRLRASWALIAAGAGCWALGEVVWSYYELIADVATPFPSAADIGYLLFPILAGVGILVRPSRAFTGRGAARVGLDVALVVVSLFTVSWVTALGAVYRGGADSTVAALVALSYPGSDVALLTVVLIVLTYANSGVRIDLGWLGAGLACFAIADSGFAYLTASGAYRTGDLIDAGWLAGFLVLACSAAFDTTGMHSTTGSDLAPRSALLLPYLPAAVAIVATLWRLHATRDDYVAIATTTATVCLLTSRQILVLLDNRQLMVRITHQALHDVLTGLGNRALFADRLEHALDLHRRDMRAVSLLLIDLDDFKTVNDSLGHPAGDELLIRVSERLIASVRSGDTVARLGGDEFAVLIEDGSDPAGCAHRIISSLEQPVQLGPRRIPVGASIGLAALLPEDAPTNAPDLLRHADIAMYAAKRGGKNRIVAYSAELTDDHRVQLDMRAALANDLAEGHIDVALQPIQRADGGHYGAEALARWHHDGNNVPPSVFLPIAAGLGLSARLDEIVLTKALAAAVEWPPGHVLSVNFSGETLATSGLGQRVAALLRAADYPAHRLAVEVLESSLIEQDTAALYCLGELRHLGVCIAVDDFGAGYSSVARLHALQPDIIKIDRSLIAAYDGSQQTDDLLHGISRLAHQFSALVIAEGVETGPQLAAAIAAGSDAIQGYLIGRPSISIPTSGAITATQR